MMVQSSKAPSKEAFKKKPPPKMVVPDELKLETYAIRKHEVVLDRIEAVMSFWPGKGNKGAVLKSYIDAISTHDEIVKQIEDKWHQIDDLRRDFNKKNRIFRNLDSSFTIMNAKPEELMEFQELKPKMRNITKRLEQITDAKLRANAEAEYRRYLHLEPTCERMLDFRMEVTKARDLRDEARRLLMEAEKELNAIRDIEKDAASRITDDHIIADERHISLAELFPNIRIGYVLSAINGNDVETLDFEAIFDQIKRLRPPQRAEFKRYDYRYDLIRGKWNSLHELREMGVCVEDPMITVSCCVQR